MNANQLEHDIRMYNLLRIVKFSKKLDNSVKTSRVFYALKYDLVVYDPLENESYCVNGDYHHRDYFEKHIGYESLEFITYDNDYIYYNLKNNH